MNRMHIKKTLLLPQLATLLMFCIGSISVMATEQSSAVLTIDVPFVELHSGPGKGYPVIHVIEKNESITVVLKRTSWLKVHDKRGIEGWVNEDDLQALTLLDESTKNTNSTFSNHYLESGVLYGEFEGANYYNFFAGYAFSPVISTEFSAGKVLGSLSDSTIFQAMLMAQPYPELTVVPFIGIGGGIINTSPHSILADSTKRQNALMSTAVGVKYHLARNFVLRAEYNFSLVLTDRDTNEEIKTWKIGFSVFF